VKYVFVALACTALAGAAVAAQEGASPSAVFSIAWEGRETVGPITARGSRGPDGSLQRLTVVAFGRTTEVPAEVMAELSKLRFNGVLLSSEPGYPELGGRTAYLQFVVGFTSGVINGVIVAVDEGGSVRILSRDTQP
jgi:hypothetical protein